MSPAIPKDTESSTHLPDLKCRHFSLDEIRSAILACNETILGRGGFGVVFKGYIKDGPDGPTTVAIKRSKSTSSQTLTPQFWAEVEMLSTVRHGNLVSLIGYCNEGPEMALVYKYMSNGTLEDHLHKDGAPLTWLQLLKICIGAAQGLDYLHTKSEAKPSIIHRDVKSSNILLDTDCVAKISDFGIAKVGPINPNSTHVSTAIKGTNGYLDPSYFLTGHLRTESDVYAFGVVLLEVISGLRHIYTSNGNAMALASWAQGCINQGKLSDIIDHRLRNQVSSKCGKEFARIACACINEKQKKRPKMAEVVSRLEKILLSQERQDFSTPKPKVFDRIRSCFRPNVELKDNKSYMMD